MLAQSSVQLLLKPFLLPHAAMVCSIDQLIGGWRPPCLDFVAQDLCQHYLILRVASEFFLGEMLWQCQRHFFVAPRSPAKFPLEGAAPPNFPSHRPLTNPHRTPCAHRPSLPLELQRILECQTMAHRGLSSIGSTGTSGSTCIPRKRVQAGGTDSKFPTPGDKTTI